MTINASESTMSVTTVELTEEMATTVLMVEWMVKQLQLLKEKQRQIETLQPENEQLKDSLDKLKNRDSQNSSIPPSQDLLKKPSDKSKRKKSKKRGPKYNHPGKTRNGFGKPDQVVSLELENCPLCGAELEEVEEAPEKVQQVAEVVEQPVEIREYRRPLYNCPRCEWSGYSSLPQGMSKKDSAMGGDFVALSAGWVMVAT